MRTHVNVGDPVEQYPDSAWTRIPAEVNTRDLWALVGPQVERYMQRLPL